MALELSVALESDADRIAAVHMAAFGTNALLQAQFPTAAIREQLQLCIAKKAVDDIKDPKTAVLVVRHQNEVISFAKWSLPVLASERYVEPPWQWPEGTNYAVLDPWTERVEVAKEKILGDAPHYRKLLRDSLFYQSPYVVQIRVFARSLDRVLRYDDCSISFNIIHNLKTLTLLQI